jgi:undecaprenyl-diphosphatase
MRISAGSLWAKVEFSVLLAGVLIAGCLWGFVELMEVARDATPHAFDTRILLAFRETADPQNPIGPYWLEEAVRDVTALGSASVLIMLTASVFFYLLISGRTGTALYVLAAVSGGQALSSLLKFGVDRPRPELVPHLADVYTTSFPSGHAMMSSVTYLTLGALLATGQPPGMKVYVMSVAALATALVGLSRVYLGVHWPSDVLAGWCAGAAWALLCWLMARWLRRPGAAEPA